ncbi:MAG: hypothetical protein LBT89_03110 [Planctomycetaceae bacterium]|jgi:hypothetical protein|nr:hypothetical protein [Planctomycetaceae bacterium]
MKYVLSCPCGLAVNVEPAQAGQTAVCSCGKTLSVPSLVKLRSLPVAEEEKTERSKSAGKRTGFMRKALLAVGIVLLIPGLLFFLRTVLSPPQPYEVLNKRVYFSYGANQKPLLQNSTPLNQNDVSVLMMTDQGIDSLMPFELYLYFRSLKEPTFSYNFQDNYQAVKDTHQVWLIWGGIWLAAALVCVVLSFFMPKQNVEITGWSGSEWK